MALKRVPLIHFSYLDFSLTNANRSRITRNTNTHLAEDKFTTCSFCREPEAAERLLLTDPDLTDVFVSILP